ncbi:hypothetical protein M565_ctg1P0792 [Vibrio cyclitrophicus FF75]|nr:hypothetical protein M565_ctg1P0792 [Vibrio cyclitrophicus FF75]
MAFGSMQQGLINSPCLYDSLIGVIQNVSALKATQSTFWH